MRGLRIAPSYAALLCRFRGDMVERILERHLPGLAIGAVVSIAVLLVLTRPFLLGPLTVPSGETIDTVCLAILLIASIWKPDGGVSRPLDTGMQQSQRAASTVGTS